MGGPRWKLDYDTLDKGFKQQLTSPSLKDILGSTKQSTFSVTLRCKNCGNLFDRTLQNILNRNGELISEDSLLCTHCTLSKALTGKKLSEVTRQHMSESQIRRYSDPNEKLRSSLAQKKSYKENPDRSIKQGLRMQDYFKIPENRRRHSVAIRKSFQDHPDSIVKMSEATTMRNLKYYDENPDRKFTLINFMKEHPECYTVFYTSSGEKSVEQFITSLGIPIKPHDRTLLSPKEIDILIPELNLGIEYNGIYHHATTPVYFKDTFDHYKPHEYHFNKFQQCRDQGVRLIQITDYAWEDPYQQGKIKAYLRDLLTKGKRVYYARKLNLNLVSPSDAKAFYEEYHLQGCNTKFPISLGLYDGTELISCMSFGKSRVKGKVTTEGYYELHRYCVKSGCTVLGGAEKLFKYFLRTHRPLEIKSFSDNDYFSGDIYRRLGFKEVDHVRVYYWWRLGELLSREECQLSKLKVRFPESYNEACRLKESGILGNREIYIMEKEGYFRYTTSGRTKWVYTHTPDLLN